MNIENIKTEENIINLNITKEELEYIVSGLILNNDMKRELGLKLIQENHKRNKIKIDQLTKDMENIKTMIRKYNDLLYGGLK